MANGRNNSRQIKSIRFDSRTNSRVITYMDGTSEFIRKTSSGDVESRRVSSEDNQIIQPTRPSIPLTVQPTRPSTPSRPTDTSLRDGARIDRNNDTYCNTPPMVIPGDFEDQIIDGIGYGYRIVGYMDIDDGFESAFPYTENGGIWGAQPGGCADVYGNDRNLIYAPDNSSPGAPITAQWFNDDPYSFICSCPNACYSDPRCRWEPGGIVQGIGTFNEPCDAERYPALEEIDYRPGGPENGCIGYACYTYCFEYGSDTHSCRKDPRCYVLGASCEELYDGNRPATSCDDYNDFSTGGISNLNNIDSLAWWFANVCVTSAITYCETQNYLNVDGELQPCIIDPDNGRCAEDPEIPCELLQELGQFGIVTESVCETHSYQGEFCIYCDHPPEGYNGSLCLQPNDFNSFPLNGCPDCNGDSNGEAFVSEFCGCIGGETGFDANDTDYCCGCTEPTATNYDPNAPCDNGTCQFEIPPVIAVDDEECNSVRDCACYQDPAFCECECFGTEPMYQCQGGPLNGSSCLPWIDDSCGVDPVYDSNNVFMGTRPLGKCVEVGTTGGYCVSSRFGVDPACIELTGCTDPDYDNYSPLYERACCIACDGSDDNYCCENYIPPEPENLTQVCCDQASMSYNKHLYDINYPDFRNGMWHSNGEPIAVCSGDEDGDGHPDACKSYCVGCKHWRHDKTYGRCAEEVCCYENAFDAQGNFIMDPVRWCINGGTCQLDPLLLIYRCPDGTDCQFENLAHVPWSLVEDCSGINNPAGCRDNASPLPSCTDGSFNPIEITDKEQCEALGCTYIDEGYIEYSGEDDPSTEIDESLITHGHGDVGDDPSTPGFHRDPCCGGSGPDGMSPKPCMGDGDGDGFWDNEIPEEGFKNYDCKGDLTCDKYVDIVCIEAGIPVSSCTYTGEVINFNPGSMYSMASKNEMHFSYCRNRAMNEPVMESFECKNVYPQSSGFAHVNWSGGYNYDSLVEYTPEWLFNPEWYHPIDISNEIWPGGVEGGFYPFGDQNSMSRLQITDKGNPCNCQHVINSCGQCTDDTNEHGEFGTRYYTAVKGPYNQQATMEAFRECSANAFENVHPCQCDFGNKNNRLHDFSFYCPPPTNDGSNENDLDPYVFGGDMSVVMVHMCNQYGEGWHYLTHDVYNKAGQLIVDDDGNGVTGCCQEGNGYHDTQTGEFIPAPGFQTVDWDQPHPGLWDIDTSGENCYKCCKCNMWPQPRNFQTAYQPGDSRPPDYVGTSSGWINVYDMWQQGQPSCNYNSDEIELGWLNHGFLAENSIDMNCDVLGDFRILGQHHLMYNNYGVTGPPSINASNQQAFGSFYFPEYKLYGLERLTTIFWTSCYKEDPFIHDWEVGKQEACPEPQGYYERSEDYRGGRE